MKTYKTIYHAPWENLILYGNESALTGLRFPCQCTPSQEDVCSIDDTLPVFQQTRSWLDLYFSGSIPDFVPPLFMEGTDFQKEIWKLLLEIPYGQTTTYGTLAKQIATKHGGHMSAQAVGGAVGKNPIGIIVPCHRVIGAKGQLTGYAGGLDNKIALLNLERNYL